MRWLRGKREGRRNVLDLIHRRIQIDMNPVTSLNELLLLLASLFSHNIDSFISEFESASEFLLSSQVKGNREAYVQTQEVRNLLKIME